MWWKAAKLIKLEKSKDIKANCRKITKKSKSFKEHRNNTGKKKESARAKQIGILIYEKQSKTYLQIVGTHQWKNKKGRRGEI